MKPVLLSVDGETFIIDTNEAGEAQIRKATAAVLDRDRIAHARRGTCRGCGQHTSYSTVLKVEALP